MKKFFAVLLLILSTNAMADTCLDISGTFKVNSPESSPACARGQRAVSSWYRHSQKSCSELTHSTVYKLVDGSICESPKTTLIADGQEHATSNPDYLYKYDIFASYHKVTIIPQVTGKIFSVTTQINSDGNLVVEDSDGGQEIFVKEPIQ